MPGKTKLAITAASLLVTAGGATAVAAIIPDPTVAPALTSATAEEYRQTLDAMKPPKRARPLVVVLGDNRGTEAIDFLVPYGVLRRSGVADVVAVAMTKGPLKLRPALTIDPHLTVAEFDRRVPSGADYVIVPAMFDHRSPQVMEWIRSQSAKGATIMSICSGAEILANAGLLRDRTATSHWTSIGKIRETEPTMRWASHRRYVADRGIISTTGVSAAIPATVALVEAIAGPLRARELAGELGIRDWGRSHDSGAYRVGGDFRTVVLNTAARWNHEDVGVPVADGVDDIALALTADSWSRTYRSRALTLASARRVKTRYGLNLVVDRHSRQGLERMLTPVETRQPAQALDRTLARIGSAYGQSTARLVAVQLEYDKPGS